MAARSLSAATLWFWRPATWLALSAISLGAAAQTGGTSPAKTPSTHEAAFKRADVNGDGKLSSQEAERLPAIAAKFAQLDTNKDGALSLGEFAVGYNNAAP